MGITFSHNVVKERARQLCLSSGHYTDHFANCKSLFKWHFSSKYFVCQSLGQCSVAICCRDCPVCPGLLLVLGFMRLQFAMEFHVTCGL